MLSPSLLRELVYIASKLESLARCIRRIEGVLTRVDSRAKMAVTKTGDQIYGEHETGTQDVGFAQSVLPLEGE